MKDAATNRSWASRGKGTGGESTPLAPPRIRIDVPMGTSLYDIQENVFRQAWQLAGSQLRAAIALGITPETISRFLRRCDRAKFACPKVPEAWPPVTPPEPPLAVNRAIEPTVTRATGSSGDRALDRKNTPFVAPGPDSEYEETDLFSDRDDDTERNE